MVYKYLGFPPWRLSCTLVEVHGHAQKLAGYVVNVSAALLFSPLVTFAALRPFHGDVELSGIVPLHLNLCLNQCHNLRHLS